MAGDRDGIEDLLAFDWDTSKLRPSPKPSPPLQMKQKETWTERVKRMLLSMHGTVINCTMCPLGRQKCDEKHTVFDPHVFSTMNPSKWMVVGQNPGFNECMEHVPFVGDAGKFFDQNLILNGFKRSDFYITNTCKCYTVGNAKPAFEHVTSCEPILRMELNLLKPHLIITLGAVSFDVFCPDKRMSDHLGKVVKSDKFGVKVFPIYHPSPRNINLSDRREKFIRDMRMLCRLVKAYRKK